MSTPQDISDKCVWTTLITNTKYLSGLLTLDFSLKKVNSKYRLVALYTDTFTKEGHEALDVRGIPKIKISYLLPVKSKDYSKDPRFYDCWSKLQPFSLLQFEKVVQLDSDMVVLKNMDELFELQLNDNDRVFGASHACVCNPYGYDHYPKDWIKENCAFTNYQDHLISDEEIYGPPPQRTKLQLCNGGLLVVKPSAKAYNKILETLSRDDIDYEFADQSLLSDVFQGKWVGLSYIYNYLKTMRLIHQNLDFNKVKNIHYILATKPWDVESKDRRSFKDDTGTFKYWWDVNDERLESEKLNKKIQDVY